MNAVRALTVGMSRELRARTGLLLLGFLALPPLLIERSRDGWGMFVCGQRAVGEWRHL